MHCWNAVTPIAVNVGHVLPWCEWASEGVEQSLGRLVNFGDTENVIDIADDGQTGGRDQVCSSVSESRSTDISVYSLNLIRLVSSGQTIALNWQENVKVALVGSVVWQSDILSASRAGRTTTTTWLTTRTLATRRLDVDRSNLHVALLNNKDLGCQVARLVLLTFRKLINACADQELVRKIVEVLSRSVWLLVDVTVESHVPSLICPVGVRVDIQGIGRQRSQFGALYA